jgi:ribonuclease HI
MLRIDVPGSEIIYTPSMSSEQNGLWPAASAGEGTITAYCDGGSRGNPGPAGFGVFIQGAKGETVGELSEYLGKRTNNYAEYSGLLAALDFALTQGHPRLKVVSDSELMVKQIKGQYRVNSPELKPLYEEAKRRIARLELFQIQHVLREKNQRADRLANLAMDRGTGRVSGSGDGEAGRPATVAEKPQTLRGFVKGGVVHLMEGELPEGVFVRITPERRS